MICPDSKLDSTLCGCLTCRINREPLAPATGSASEDWQITALTPWGYFEMDCNSGRTRRVSHDWGYKLNVEPPNRELSHG